MLRVNVGLSRKLSKDYNSTGYSVNIDGEVTAPVSDPEAVIEQVKELFDLAEESLAQQIDRAQGDAAIGSRDSEPETSRTSAGSNGHRSTGNGQTSQRQTPRNENGNGRPEDTATDKQVNYLLNIGKRQKLSTAQLEQKIAEILGRQVGLYDLSKQSAAVVIDALTNGATANGKSNGRR